MALAFAPANRVTLPIEPTGILIILSIQNSRHSAAAFVCLNAHREGMHLPLTHTN